MHFANLSMLGLLWLSVALGIFLLWAGRRRKERLRRFASEELIKELSPKVSDPRYFYRNLCLLGVVVFSVISLARPQWGFEWQEIKRQGLDIIVAIDTSRSMLTEDVKPNRLERTKLAVRDLLRSLKGDRIGLIAFAGDAFLVCPLTVDYGGFYLALDELNTKTIPQGGSNLEQSIRSAIKTFDKITAPNKILIIATDGDNLEGDPLIAAKEAREKGITIYSAGIGTPEGEVIRIRNDAGDYEFLKNPEGNFVKSRLNESLLQQVAQETGGAYVRATGTQFGLDYIYDQNLAQLEKRELETKMQKKFHEKFQIPLAIALFLLVLEKFLNPKRAI